jgi:hypothetical protein
MQNHTVRLGSATPFPSQAGPRAPTPPALSPARRCLVGLACDRHRHPSLCHGPPVSPPLSVSGRQRARGARRPCAPCSGRCRASPAGQGQAPRCYPTLCGTPAAGVPLSLSFSVSVASPTGRFKTCLKHRLLLHHPLLSGLPLERHTFPHRSPRPNHHLRPSEAPPLLGFRPSAATVRHSPLSSSPSLQSSRFLAISSPP